MNKFDFIDWPATVAKFGYQHQQLHRNDKVIIRCSSCANEMEMSFSSVRNKHGKEFNPTCRQCGQRKVWEQPGYSDNQTTTHKVSTKKQWEDKDYRAKVVAGVTKAHADNPEYTAKAVAATQSNQAAEKRIAAIKQKYATDPTYKEKIAAASKLLWANSRKLKATFASAEFRKKMSDSICELYLSGCYPYNYGNHNSPKAGLIHYRSSYELNYYRMLDADDLVESYSTESFAIDYEFEGATKRYIPDLLICYIGRTVLCEIKPNKWVSAPINLAKAQAALKYCNEHGLEFETVTEINTPGLLEKI